MKIISSFSGGRTSAYMTIKLKEKYQDLIVVFANTGQERSETLNFVHMCDKKYKLNVVWLESVTYFHSKKSSGYNIVDFQTADRNGVVFENMIKKYGIPNKSWLHCTRELKANPIKNWIKDKIKGPHKMAIGIRTDEKKRASKNEEIKNLFYPLIDWKISKIDVNDFWEIQEFDLGLRDYQGNCKFCFKKSNNKLLAIAKENPEFFNFTDRMEREYPFSGANRDGKKRVFFRNKKSTQDLLFDAENLSADVLRKFRKSIDPDATSPCSESCEAFR